MEQTASEAVMTLKELIVYLKRSRSTIYKDKMFPKPIKFGRSSRWLLREVDAWLAARTHERDNRQ